MNLSPWQENSEFISQAHQPATYIDRYAYLIGMTGFLSAPGEAIELLDMQPVWWVPNLPPQVRGVTNVHGFLAPVLDLEVLFDQVSPGPARWLLVLGGEQSAGGLADTQFAGKKRFNSADHSMPASCPSALANHVRGAYPGTQGAADKLPAFWLDFDHQSYFDSGDAFS